MLIVFEDCHFKAKYIRIPDEDFKMDDFRPQNYSFARNVIIDNLNIWGWKSLCIHHGNSYPILINFIEFYNTAHDNKKLLILESMDTFEEALEYYDGPLDTRFINQCNRKLRKLSMKEIDYIPTKEEEERINTLFAYRPDGKLYKEAKNECPM